MKRYWFIIALIGLTAGCKTSERHETYKEHHETHGPPPAMAMHDGMRPMMGAGSPGVIYYQEASKTLIDSRQNGYISNDQFVNMLEKLQDDLRQIMVAEAASPHRPPMHRMEMKERHEEHHEMHHEHGEE